MRIAVIGANGFVGSALVTNLQERQSFKVFPVTRETFYEFMPLEFDVVVNAAMPSKRFAALNNPKWDFNETVEKTKDIYYKYRFHHFIQISSISARSQLHTVYGRHKAAAENLIDLNKHLVVRLGPLFGTGLKKGVIIDMLKNRTVFASSDSLYSFINTKKITKLIVDNIDKSGIIELGAKSPIKLAELAKYCNSTSEFSGTVDNQIVCNSDFPGLPEIEDIFEFIDEQKQNK